MLTLECNEEASAIVRAVDACIDRFVAKVEAVFQRDGADELLKRIDAIMPAGEEVPR